MISQKVNGISLKQAVEEFGSLQKAINSLKIQKKTLQTDLLALTRDMNSKEKTRVKYLEDLNHLKKTIEERKQNLDDLEKAFRKYRQDANEFIDNNKQLIVQYYMVEGFVAMLHTSPSTKESIKELASNILMMGEAVWKFSNEPNKLRRLFVHTVLGEHLHCYRCDRCGLKLITNKEPQSHITGYWCPDCGVLSSLKADNSFLEAMLNSSDPADAKETQDQEG